MLSNDRIITVNHNFAPHHNFHPPFEAKRWSQKLRASAAARHSPNACVIARKRSDFSKYLII